MVWAKNVLARSLSEEIACMLSNAAAATQQKRIALLLWPERPIVDRPAIWTIIYLLSLITIADMDSNFLESIAQNFGVSNLYQVLLVQNDCSRDELKRAYLRRSLDFHPDRFVDPNEKETMKIKFQLLNKIHELLSCQKTRKDYDRQLMKQQNTSDKTNLYDVVQLSQCQLIDGAYVYQCRCSGSFIVPKTLFLSNQVSLVIVECDSCSISVKICPDTLSCNISRTNR